MSDILVLNNLAIGTEENIDYSKLKTIEYNFDVVYNDTPLRVFRVPGYCHSIEYRNGVQYKNDTYVRRRNEPLSRHNIMTWDITDDFVNWGIVYSPRHILDYSDTSGSVVRHISDYIITRNGKKFCDDCYSISEAEYKITKFKSHPLGLNLIDFDREMIGRKISWMGQPATIESFVNGRAFVTIIPDDGAFRTLTYERDRSDRFKCREHRQSELTLSILSDKINWFR